MLGASFLEYYLIAIWAVVVLNPGDPPKVEGNWITREAQVVGI